MDFFSNDNEKGKPMPSSHQPHNPNHHPKPSKSELLNSAKVVADAAKSHLRHEENKVDMYKVAGAAEDLLNAASEYGKLDDNEGLGKYVDKAENYLHKYHTSHSTTTTTTNYPHHSTTTTTTETTHTSSHTDGDHGHSKGGYEEYIKMAEGVLKKHSGGSGGATNTSHSSAHSEGGHGNSGSGYGEYIKLAGDFMKKR